MAQLIRRTTARGEARYDVRTRIAGRVVTRTFARRKDADIYVTTIEADKLRGTAIDPRRARITFGEYATKWLDQRLDLRPSTRELYGLLWRRWLEPTFGPTSLSSMTREDWRAWFLRVRADHPESTQPAKAYRLARAILNTAVDDGILTTNPCRIKGAGQEHAAERPIVAPADVAQIADAIEPRYKALVLLGAYCSMRIGELAGLRRRRLDLLHRTVRIEEQAVELGRGEVIFGPPKTAASQRTIAIPSDLIPVLEDHLAKFVGTDVDALVFSSPNGYPLRRTKFRATWAAACKAAGVESVHFHDLRGSGATWAAVNGATLREVMSRLGHTTPVVALRYQHATLERDHVIADRLNAYGRAAHERQCEPNAESATVKALPTAQRAIAAR